MKVIEFCHNGRRPLPPLMGDQSDPPLSKIMCGSMVDIQSPAAEIRPGKKKKEERKKPQGKNIMACPIP